MLNGDEGDMEMECSGLDLGRDRAAWPEGELNLLILVERGEAGRGQRNISMIITKHTTHPIKAPLSFHTLPVSPR